MRSLIYSILFFIIAAAGCGHLNEIDPAKGAALPKTIVWAWERPEDLRFLDPSKFGVAFLAQTIVLEKDTVLQKARRQPLQIAPGSYIIAVTRIETAKAEGMRPGFQRETVERTASLVLSTLELPNVRGIQVDFDAVSSERSFYRQLMSDVRGRMPGNTSLTMTSLASWCTGDAWFNDFPVDEAVPMVFEMGADSEKIKAFLRNGQDWQEPLCRGSYGLAVDEPLDLTINNQRRRYYFKSSSWSQADLERLR